MTWGDKAKPKQNTLVILFLLCFHYFILNGEKTMLFFDGEFVQRLCGLSKEILAVKIKADKTPGSKNGIYRKAVIAHWGCASRLYGRQCLTMDLHHTTAD